MVTGPDLRGGEEAAAFVKQFQQLLRHIGTSDGNMEDGSLRVDVNVSVRAPSRTGSQTGGRAAPTATPHPKRLRSDGCRRIDARVCGVSPGPEVSRVMAAATYG